MEETRHRSVPSDRLRLKSNALTHKTMSEQIFQLLRDAILSRKLPAGAPLTEAHLARKFGVSSTPIREALQKLVHHGLADREAAKGVRIHTLTRQEAKEYYELRLSLEPLALSQSGPKLQEADFERLEKVLGKIDAAVRADDTERLFRLARSFSSHLISRADNRLLLEWLETLSDRQALVRHRLSSMGYRAETLRDERREVLKVVRTGDIAHACEIMRKYIEQAMVFVLTNWSDEAEAAEASPREVGARYNGSAPTRPLLRL